MDARRSRYARSLASHPTLKRPLISHILQQLHNLDVGSRAMREERVTGRPVEIGILRYLPLFGKSLLLRRLHGTAL